MTGDMTRKMASRASGDPFYLGWHLVRYAEMRGMSMGEIAMELGCLPETIDSISLCRAPRAEPPHFQDDIERVAERFQVRADRLLGIVRYAQMASEESMLLAARARNEEVCRDSALDD